MKRFLRDIDENDIILYIGSSGLVINIDSHIDFIKGNCNITSILNNLDKTKFIKEDSYSHIFYEDGISAIDKINEIILKKMK